MRRFGSLLACSLVSVSLVAGCNPSADPDPVATGFTDNESNDNSGNASAGTAESEDEGEEGTDTNDDGGGECASLDCGFGAGVENPDPATRATEPCICECADGYINDGGTTECVLDEDCIEVRPLECRTSVDEGSAVGMIFSLTYCSGDPKTDLDINDLILEEIQLKDWEELLPSESAATIIEEEPLHHIYIAVDISQSVQDAGLLPELETALEGFIDQLIAQGHPVRLGIFAFDGAYPLYPVVPDTDDLAAAKAGVSGISSVENYDPLSTNLYGAVINGIIGNDRMTHKRKTASRRGLLTTGTVIVVSDGDDEAGRKTLEEVEAELDRSTTNIITVGLGAEANYPNLSALGRDGNFAANTPDQIASTFVDLANRMDEFTKSTYVLGYCSPKRGGTAQVRARFKNIPDSPAAVCEIDATFFDAGCSADTFVEASACANRECGGLIGCGTCADGFGCIGGSCEAVTQGVLGLDEDCNDQAQCAAGFACINTTCQVPADDGAPCNPGCDVPNSYCYNDGMGSVCAPTFPNGTACSDHKECESGQCGGYAGIGVNSGCSDRPPYRESCQVSCEWGSYCPGANQKCERIKYDYEECTQDKECRSGVCGEFPDNHKACLPAQVPNYSEAL